MYTILINDDNTLTKSVVERIMHRSNNVNTIQFLMNPTYAAKNGQIMNMEEFMVTLEYVLPISRTYITKVLTPEPELYKDRLRYLFPLTTEFTKEIGEVELKFTMTKLDMLEDGTKVEYVRQVSETYVNILSVENWSDYIASSDLSNMAELMLVIQSQQEQLKAYAEQLNIMQARDIKLDIQNDSIHLVNENGEKIGTGIATKELADEVVDVSEQGLIEVITI